jgi:hypothetical protein
LFQLCCGLLYPNIFWILIIRYIYNNNQNYNYNYIYIYILCGFLNRGTPSHHRFLSPAPQLGQVETREERMAKRQKEMEGMAHVFFFAFLVLALCIFVW